MQVNSSLSPLPPARSGSEKSMDVLLNRSPVLQWLAQLLYHSTSAGGENQSQLRQLFEAPPEASELKDLISFIKSIEEGQIMTQKTVYEVHQMSIKAIEKFVQEPQISSFPRRTYTPPFHFSY